MDGGNNARTRSRLMEPATWLAGAFFLLVLGGCSHAAETDEPAPVTAPATTALTPADKTPVVEVTTTTAAPEPATATTGPSTTTTIVPEPVAATGELLAPIEELTTGELDDLVAELEQILVDLDSSFAQEEGETFND